MPSSVVPLLPSTLSPPANLQPRPAPACRWTGTTPIARTRTPPASRGLATVRGTAAPRKPARQLSLAPVCRAPCAGWRSPHLAYVPVPPCPQLHLDPVAAACRAQVAPPARPRWQHLHRAACLPLLTRLSWPASLAGECERNVAFMIGSRDLPGHCIKSCGKCASFYEYRGAQDEL